MVQFFLVFSDTAFLILRVVLGAILLVHGIPKLRDRKKTAIGFEEMGFRPGKFWGTLVAVVEALAGVLFVFGLFTQIAAVVVAIEFIVILVGVKKFKQFAGYELDMLILAGALVLVTVGGGVWSLDSIFKIVLY